MFFNVFVVFFFGLGVIMVCSSDRFLPISDCFGKGEETHCSNKPQGLGFQIQT